MVLVGVCVAHLFVRATSLFPFTSGSLSLSKRPQSCRLRVRSSPQSQWQGVLLQWRNTTGASNKWSITSTARRFYVPLLPMLRRFRCWLPCPISQVGRGSTGKSTASSPNACYVVGFASAWTCPSLAGPWITLFLQVYLLHAFILSFEPPEIVGCWAFLKPTPAAWLRLQEAMRPLFFTVRKVARFRQVR